MKSFVSFILITHCLANYVKCLVYRDIYSRSRFLSVSLGEWSRLGRLSKAALANQDKIISLKSSIFDHRIRHCQKGFITSWKIITWLYYVQSAWSCYQSNWLFWLIILRRHYGYVKIIMPPNLCIFMYLCQDHMNLSV